MIFATYHNAGVRVFDSSNAHEPAEVAYFVPGAPEKVVDIRPGAERVVQSTDVFAADDGTLFVTDTNGDLIFWRTKDNRLWRADFDDT